MNLRTVCVGGTLTDFHIKAAATKSVTIVAQVDKVHSASAKNDLSLPNFAILMSACNMATLCS